MMIGRCTFKGQFTFTKPINASFWKKSGNCQIFFGLVTAQPLLNHFSVARFPITAKDMSQSGVLSTPQSTVRSSHGSKISPISSANRVPSWKRVLLDPTSSDQEIDPSDFEDVRCEIQATGYHLVRPLSFPYILLITDDTLAMHVFCRLQFL